MGLSIGLACSILITFYVLDEFSYDKCNEQADPIYRIEEQIKFGDYKYNGSKEPAYYCGHFYKEFYGEK